MNDGVLWIGVEACVVVCDMQEESHRIRLRYSNHLEKKELDIAHLETFRFEGISTCPKTLVERAYQVKSVNSS